ncbi:telomere repeat binding factor family protein [Aspergillus thermomutatus]|uniref:Uncharacterized protein n=1 Tax=Aspergillus thermomutatus TaxID=41047 RepID=A0A397GG62_ASPTH|nr:uncharacterized protein CDV56_104320 [Aspergillus thermomutatus]RHZ48003.1 hypothetical protein CDV56_104320 [Aspergillus thermomutatus]
MARSRSRSALAAQGALVTGSTGENAPMKHVIPNSPRRRVTRSRSRELESTGRFDDVGPAGAPVGGAQRWGQNKGRTSLGVVVEEPPFQSPHKSVHRYADQVISESLDDTVNISGTTFLPEEPDTNPDPDMMMETLPDLERAAKNVLDYLVPGSADPVSIINTAKRLTDPNSTQSKRLRHSVSNLAVQAKWFGPQTYIDVKHVSQLLTSALEKKNIRVGRDWSADPILHQANCARFALEVLLANAGTDSARQAIKNLENLFPLPFMNDLSENRHERAAGESSLHKDTFDLALEIRTQSLILKLEEDQYRLDFLPVPSIRQHFFDVDAFDEDDFDSSEAPLLGLNLGRFRGSDGHFPEQFRDAVCDRYNEILVLISETGDDSFDIKELKSAYRWQRFVLRAVQWLRKRIQEIAQGLQGQQSTQTVHTEFFADQEPVDRIHSATTTPRPSVTPALEKRAPVTAAPDDGQQGLAPPRAEERVWGAPQEDRRASVSTAESRERRKSSKSVYLNPVSIQRLMQRQQRRRLSREASEARRQSDFVAPVMHGESASPASRLRHQTLPAPSQPIRRAHEEPDEIAASSEGSPTLLPEDHYLSVDDSQLNIGDHVGAELERSHSPPVVNRIAREHHREPSSGHRPRTPSRPSFVPSTQDILRAVEETQTPRQPVQRARLDRRQAFIDRQDNAERVSPISQEADLLSAARRREPPPASRKRARQESDDEDVSSDDFSSYGPALDISRKRKEKAELQRSKRQRLEEDHDESASQLQQGLEASTQNEEAQGQWAVAHRVETSPQTQRSPSRQWAKTSDFGSNRTFTPSQSKGRQRWTPAEDARLIRLVGEHGCKWATIMRQNDAQAAEDGEVQIEGRDQIQLKDRARNLKIAFLRDGLRLPKNFEAVTMKASDYAMLEKRGVKVPKL